MTITIRRVRPSEHERVGQLILTAYDAVGRIVGPYRDELGDTALRVAEGAVVLVAVEDGPDGRVLGSVTYADTDSPDFEHPGEGDCGFRMLAVDPAAQGRGVGRALVRACVDRARSDGRSRMAIYSMEWMPAAHALYASLGFVRRPDRDVRFPSGIGYVFELDLAPDAIERFGGPGAVPDEPPWYRDAWAARQG